MTLGKRIKFMMLENVCNLKVTTLLPGLNDVWKIHAERGYDISTMFMKNEIKALSLDIKGVKINLNTTVADKHVPGIECQIRVVEECARSVWNTLPFHRLPYVTIVELIRQVVMWLNALPVASGFSGTYSPRTISTGTTLEFTKYFPLEFGAYIETHNSPHPTNMMDTQTMPCLNLGPTGNLQGTHKSLNLQTSRTVKQ